MPTTEDFEKLGVFYLGRPYDISADAPGQGIVLYDSKDLLTHAVCVGMTGSGKTGLCISLIEEAAMDSIPVLAIDPKGDLGNLLLTFPDLKSEDFAPWVDPAEAERKGLSLEEYATEQAEFWRKGLEIWGESGERIRRLRESADFTIYTPGSSAGRRLSMLKSFAVPEVGLRDDKELLRESIGTTVTSLLGLMGIDADPLQSREHILLSTILAKAWSETRDLDLGSLIQEIQHPTFNRIGVMELDSFYPPGDRFKLAMSVNNLLASPSFAEWMEGEPLDITSLLYTRDARPRVSIISIAHLNDAERMFVVSLLLNQVLGWVRQQSGTSSLRAILYMDEIFGFFPPVANPASKQPLLTLLKQARAYGLGVVLATQNPVDLDYKGLSNTGTWFIGRLQTERDKARVMEGLEGAQTSQGGAFVRERMEQIIAGLSKRVFLMNNVHNDAPTVFETRWAMSYLRGPLTRNQIKQLMSNSAESAPTQSDRAPERQLNLPPTAVPLRSRPSSDAPGSRPVLPPGIEQYFLPSRSSGDQRVYQPFLLGAAEIHFEDVKAGVNSTRSIVLLAPIVGGPAGVDWDQAADSEVSIEELERGPEGDMAAYEPLPPAAVDAKKYTVWARDLVNYIYRSKTLPLLKSAYFGKFSQPDESEHDFRIKLQHLVREDRDAALEKLGKKYAPKLAAVNEKLRRAEQAIHREESQASDAKMQTVLNVGSSLLGAMFGNRRLSVTNIGRAASSVRSASRAMREAQDVGRAEVTLASYQAQLEALQQEFETATDELKVKIDASTETLETVEIKPKKKDITVKLVALTWVPKP
jgi:Helicase HerA, central domain